MAVRAKTAPRILESQLQDQIVEGLRALGYEVLVTSARGKNRAGTGVDYGIPDLLVYRKAWGLGFLPLEVKRPDRAVKWSHEKQKELFEMGVTAVVRSLEDACFAIVVFERVGLRYPEPLSFSAERMAKTISLDRVKEICERGR